MNAAERNRVIRDMIARPDVLKRQTEAAARMSNPRLTERQREGSWGATEAVLGVGGEPGAVRRAAEGAAGEEEAEESSGRIVWKRGSPTVRYRGGGFDLSGRNYFDPEETKDWGGAWRLSRGGRVVGYFATATAAMAEAERAASAGEEEPGSSCSCSHAHPPSVPTEPCKMHGAREGESLYTQTPEYKWWRSAGERFPAEIAAYNKAVASMGRSQKSQQKVLLALRNIEVSMARIGEPFPGRAPSSGMTPIRSRASESAPVLHESAPVLNEPVTVTKGIEWIQVTRDPAEYEKWLKQAEKYGPIGNARKVYDLLYPRLSSEDQEIFVVVMTDVRGYLRGVVEVAKGQRSQVVVDPGDVMRPVILSGCSSFVIVHNHPSGKCAPSKADRDLMKLIDQTNKPYAPGITFTDHVVIGVKEFFSIRENKHYKV